MSPISNPATSIQVFWKKEDGIFNETDSVIQTVDLAENPANFIFKPDFVAIHALRIDPAMEQGIFYLHSINVTNTDAQTLLSWEAIKSRGCFYNMVIVKSSLVDNAWLLVAVTGDPIIEIDLPPEQPLSSPNLQVTVS